MAIDATLSDVEDELISRERGLLVLVGLSDDPEADSSPRSYLAGPIAYGVRKSGGSVASFRTPADADLATVDAAATDQFLDLAQLRLLDNCLGHWTEPDQSEGPLSQKLKDLAKFHLERAECLREKVQEVYGVDAAAPVVGTDGMGGFSGNDGGTNTGSFAYF